ncbi:hypothetical protein FCM35_KLT02587 [Carex littledalei]|uniref:Uncharacterized protein n=1 Tax=Carex littledalei TaxID=544730 RepID=A0A833QUJ6_9POAL|nr:hypothetical protein FCM35_KLT02587 [Carex littledalei]
MPMKKAIKTMKIKPSFKLLLLVGLFLDINFQIAYQFHAGIVEKFSNTGDSTKPCAVAPISLYSSTLKGKGREGGREGERETSHTYDFLSSDYRLFHDPSEIDLFGNCIVCRCLLIKQLYIQVLASAMPNAWDAAAVEQQLGKMFTALMENVSLWSDNASSS